MSQLQLHLSADGMVGDIINMIVEIQNSMNQEQVDADAAHAVVRTQCNELLPAYEQKRDSHASSQAMCEQTVVDTNELLAQAQEQHAQTVDDIAEYGRMLAEGAALREE